MISLNGSTGKVYEGKIASESSPVVAGLVEGNKKAQKHWIFKMYQTVSEWSDKFRKINVRTNADSPADSAAAIAFGAEGIGLCRTEHMFFEGDQEASSTPAERLRRYLQGNGRQTCDRTFA